MKLKRLICPKCGNTKNFRVDVQLTVASAMLEISDDIAELDIAFPNDLDIMEPICGVCGVDMRLEWRDSPPHTMCPHCVYYEEGDVVETCPRANKKNHPNDYPALL